MKILVLLGRLDLFKDLLGQIKESIFSLSLSLPFSPNVFFRILFSIFYGRLKP